MKFTDTNEQVIEKWKNDDGVWSAELGGIGPAYEQCIQIILFEIFSTWPKDQPVIDGEEYTKEYETFTDEVVSRLEKEKKYGFSGAQVGSAKSTAAQFIKYGYAHMMNKLDEDRHIMVSRYFP